MFPTTNWSPFQSQLVTAFPWKNCRQMVLLPVAFVPIIWSNIHCYFIFSIQWMLYSNWKYRVVHKPWIKIIHCRNGSPQSELEPSTTFFFSSPNPDLLDSFFIQILKLSPWHMNSPKIEDKSCLNWTRQEEALC